MESVLERESDEGPHLLNSSQDSPSIVRSLNRSLRLSSALSRYEKDQSQQFQSHSKGKAVKSVLPKQLSTILGEIDLIPSNNSERPSVIIAHTPSRSSPRTSTPSTSPSIPPPPLPPRICQSLGPILLPTLSRSCSPSCLELSSIYDNVFSDSENADNVAQIKIPLSISQAAPGTPFVQPLIIISGTMEAAENIIGHKTRSLNSMMRIHSVDTISMGTLGPEGHYREDQKEIKAILCEVLDDIENLVLDHGSTMDQTRKVNWTNQISIIENTYKDYSKKIDAKVDEVLQSRPANAGDGTSRNAIEREKNDLLRRQTEIQEKALQASIEEKSDKLNETTRVAEEKRRVSIANANVKFSTLNEDINELSERVHKVTDWEIEEDLEIGRGMRKIKSWKEDLEKIVKINRSLKEIVINKDIGEDDISLLAADALVNIISDDVYY